MVVPKADGRVRICVDLTLIPLFSTKSIDKLPVHIQRFRMTLMTFEFAIAHVPGKLMYTADSLSRSPQECKAQESKSWNDLNDEVESYVNAVLVTLPASDQRLDEIRSELKNDDTLKTVMQYIFMYRMGGLKRNKESMGQ